MGGAGMVGSAVCRRLLELNPGRLVVAARRGRKARRAVEALRSECPDTSTPILPVWGDVFLRSEWQRAGTASRGEILADPARLTFTAEPSRDPAPIWDGEAYALTWWDSDGVNEDIFFTRFSPCP